MPDNPTPNTYVVNRRRVPKIIAGEPTTTMVDKFDTLVGQDYGYWGENLQGVRIPKELPTDVNGKVDFKAIRTKKVLPTTLATYAYGTSSSGSNAELEGDEMIEYPNGMVDEIDGPSHANGGVDMNIPQGTKVYSDRIKIGENTIADRKKYRTDRIKKLFDSFGEKSDGLSKNTLKRSLDFLKMQEEHDLAIQNMAKEAIQPEGETQEFAYGTSGYEDPLTKNWNPKPWQMVSDPPAFKFTTPITSDYIPLDVESKLTSKGMPSVNSPVALEKTVSTPMGGEGEGSGEDGGLGFTAGDWVGLGGMAIGAVTQISNTIQNARATKTPVNNWLGFNSQAIATNEEAIDELGYQKDVASRSVQRNLDINANTARSRTRGSAMGMNTARALDLGIDANMNEAQVDSNNKLEGTFGQQKLNLIGQKVGLQSSQDQMERTGQDRVDDITSANLDNFYTNFGQNLASISTDVQAVGGMINKSKEKADFLKYLPMMNKWGVGINDKNELYINK